MRRARTSGGSSSPIACERPSVKPIRAAERARRRPRRQNLSRQLHGDLDLIVANAIRKEPERRYPSRRPWMPTWADTSAARPSALRAKYASLSRFEAGATHSGRKFGSCTRAPDCEAGLGSTVYQARRAERHFQEVRGLANSFVFDVHDRIQIPSGSDGGAQGDHLHCTALHGKSAARRRARSGLFANWAPPIRRSATCRGIPGQQSWRFARRTGELSQC